MRLILEASPDIVYIYDRIDRRYSFISGRSKAVLGYTPAQIEQLDPEGIERLIHPEDLARAKAHDDGQETLRDEDVSMTTLPHGARKRRLPPAAPSPEGALAHRPAAR